MSEMIGYHQIRNTMIFVGFLSAMAALILFLKGWFCQIKSIILIKFVMIFKGEHWFEYLRHQNNALYRMRQGHRRDRLWCHCISSYVWAMLRSNPRCERSIVIQNENSCKQKDRKDNSKIILRKTTTLNGNLLFFLCSKCYPVNQSWC